MERPETTEGVRVPWSGGGPRDGPGACSHLQGVRTSPAESTEKAPFQAERKPLLKAPRRPL
eukprot:13718413-Alexandrium_andersonii.AAC.1